MQYGVTYAGTYSSFLMWRVWIFGQRCICHILPLVEELKVGLPIFAILNLIAVRKYAKFYTNSLLMMLNVQTKLRNMPETYSLGIVAFASARPDAPKQQTITIQIAPESDIEASKEATVTGYSDDSGSGHAVNLIYQHALTRALPEDAGEPYITAGNCSSTPRPLITAQLILIYV
ncbi:hypothetical protein OBBRIDRAFT_804159 [Obba rivulosa]|uniref:Uncharacterized protein n=1 Tax=Obba rivulosa TaxID=1052685 RepID=A0A8E2AVW5_9APHY|nr:hypothetical protein OBBRIDRAFT_804159 [Obba rivulosa]